MALEIYMTMAEKRGELWTLSHQFCTLVKTAGDPHPCLIHWYKIVLNAFSKWEIFKFIGCVLSRFGKRPIMFKSLLFNSISSEVFGICGTISCDALWAESFANWSCRPTEHRKLQICFSPKSKLRNMQIVTSPYMISWSKHKLGGIFPTLL